MGKNYGKISYVVPPDSKKGEKKKKKLSSKIPKTFFFFGKKTKFIYFPKLLFFWGGFSFFVWPPANAPCFFLKSFFSPLSPIIEKKVSPRKNPAIHKGFQTGIFFKLKSVILKGPPKKENCSQKAEVVNNKGLSCVLAFSPQLFKLLSYTTIQWV